VAIPFRVFYPTAYHAMLVGALVASVVLTLWWIGRPAGSAAR
jgi:hypothetical protein